MTIKVFNQGPYYDDFDDSKSFHRILFKPGVAVQARELTQLQTILQTQIDRFGQNIFQDGSMVVGGKTAVDFKVKYLKINKTLSGNPVDPTTLYRVLKGTTATAQGTAVARVFTYSDTGDGYWTLLYKEESDAPFTQNENVIYQPDPAVAGTVVAKVANIATKYTGNASVFAISAGIYYIRGSFVFVDDQVIPLAYDEYNNLDVVIVDGQKPTVRVGLNVVESIVDSDSDTTLLDPALGSYNYNAPGADRYQILLELAVYPLLKPAIVVPTVNNSTGVITALTIVDAGNGYPAGSFTSTVVTFTGSTDDAIGNSAAATLSAIDANTGAVTAISLTNGGTGFKQSSATVTVAAPPDTVTNFLELARYDAQTAIKATTLPFYSEIGDTMALRTFDESGDYTVNPFTIQVSDDVGFPDKFNLIVGPGRAYVKGYRIDTIANTVVENDRARDSSHQQTVTGYNVNSYYGNYVVVNATDIAKEFDPTAMPNVNLYDGVAALIGTAKLIYISYNDSTVSYKFHLADVIITSGSFADLRQIQLASDATTTAAITAGNAVLLDTSSTRLFHLLPQNNVKTVGDSLDFSYQVTQTATVATNSAQITQTGGIDYKEVADTVSQKSGAYIVYDTTAGTVVDLSAVTVTISNGMTSTATFDGAALIDGHNLAIVATISANNIQRKDKTLVTGQVETHSSANTITLNKWDGISLTSIMAGATDYTSRFSFDTGARDEKYDYATLTLKPGETLPEGVLTITYNYFSHGATGKYFSVDSYADYDTIPVYTAKDGSAYPLQNVLDFRYSVGGTNPIVPDVNVDINVDFTYYLGRIDRLVLTKRGIFQVLKGVPSLNPVVPPADPTSMMICTMSITPYTLNVKTDVVMTMVDNKRYTMRDIGVLDNRIKRLEYYNSLSLLEQSSQSLLILDTNGLDRFKNGTLVDNFQGQSIGDVSNPDYYAATDILDNYMTCPTVLANFLTRINNAARTDVAASGQMLTLDYDVVPFITQGLASSSISVNPFNVVVFRGNLTLNPASDFWVETGALPDVVSNTAGENDQHTVPAVVLVNDHDHDDEPGGVPNSDDHQKAFQITNKYHALNHDGVSLKDATPIVLDSTKNITKAASSSGGKSGKTKAPTDQQQTSHIFEKATKKTATKVVNTSLIPFMRDLPIQFSASGMKPNTQLFSYFDGVDVGSAVTRATVLTLETVSGGAAIPIIDAFTNPIPATVAQDTGSGIATGTIILCANGLMHVLLDDGSVDFIASGVTAQRLEMRYILQTTSGTQETNTPEYEITAVSASSNGGDPAFKTDLFGNISGSFLPADSTFYVGDRLFELTDASALVNISDAFTDAKAYYHSGGLNVLTPQVHPKVVTPRPPKVPDVCGPSGLFFDPPGGPPPTIVDDGSLDPLAQSFFVDSAIHPHGCFLDSVDLCFLNKDTTAPLRIEIRPMNNGFPDASVAIPNSVVILPPDKVNVTNVGDTTLVPSFNDPATFTHFKFPYPIYLVPATEYALIVISSSNQYDAYVAEIGALQIGTTQQITTQPYTGSLFESQNARTWTPDQTKDLMFRLNKCSFVPSGTVTLVPDGCNYNTNFEFDNLWASTNNIEFTGVAEASYGYKSTDETPTEDSTFTSFTVGEDVYFASRRIIETESTDVDAVTSQTTYTLPWLNETTDTMDIYLRTASDSMSEVLVPKTTYIVRSTGGPPGEMELVFQSTTYPLPVTGNVIRFVRGSSFQVQVSMATTDSNVSPMIDLSQFTLRFIQNQINAGSITDTSLVLPADTDLRTPYITLTSGTGSGAVLFCVMAGGALVDVVVNNGGTLYAGGDTATIVSTQSPAPSVVATIDLVIVGGVITGATITDPGAGYDTPSLAFTSASGSGASVYPIVTQTVAGIENSGKVTGWQVADGGSGYVDGFTALMTYALEDGGTEAITTITEESAKGGNCETRYICRRVTLDDGFDAEDIRVYLSAMKPQGAGVQVYYKVLSSSDGTLWSDTPYVLMQSTGDVQSASLDDYKEMEFQTVSGTTAYSGFTNYKIFAVKIVLTATNTVNVPRVKDLRVIAVDTSFS